MTPPFVGRDVELRSLVRLLDQGRNVVVCGAFGSGRTTLLRHLAGFARGRSFAFLGMELTYRAATEIVADACATARATRSPAVIVVDDVARVTPQRARWLGETLRARHCQYIVSVERMLPAAELERLRAALNAARLMRLGPISQPAAEQYFRLASRQHGWAWTRDEIRLVARSTHGHPLTMRTTLDRAVERTK